MSKKGEGVVFATIQKVGRSFFLPVSILPIAGLLLGVGASLTNEGTIKAYNLGGILGAGTPLNVLFSIFSQVGTVVFGNLPIIFAISVAIGMAKQEKAVAALSAAISFLVMHTTINALLKADGSILADGSFGKGILDGALTSVVGITSLEMGVFGGIVIGLVVAALRNRFYKQQLPSALSFFAGVRFVPIISVLVSIFVGIAFYFVWPLIQSAIFSAGGLVMKSGYFGTFIFAFMERALIPFGLHHVFYIPFWQTGLGGSAIIDGVKIVGAQNIYFAELASASTTRFSVEACRFMTGKYPFMMAGLPAAAYAMYKTAKPENRKLVGGLLVSAALTSFLTGITEPIEFTFLFVAPFLFLLHCGLAGLSFVLMHALKICIGTTFSCGFIDFLLYGPLQGNAKTNWLMIIPVFIGYAVLYFFVFKYLIQKFNLATPGREDGEAKLYSKDDFNKMGSSTGSDDELSGVILKAIGGMENLIDVDACATRLRLTVKDPQRVDDELLKQHGAKGIIKKGSGVQIIYGPHVSIIKSNFEEYIGTEPDLRVEQPLIKEKTIVVADKLAAPLAGKVVSLKDVNDSAFASEALGKGIAIIPKDGIIYAPVDGKISAVFDSNHAIGIISKNGAEVLIHVGIDTVSLKGEGFISHIKMGQTVRKGDLLLEADLEKISEKQLDTVTLMVVTNSDAYQTISTEKMGNISVGEDILSLS